MHFSYGFILLGGSVFAGFQRLVELRVFLLQSTELFVRGVQFLFRIAVFVRTLVRFAQSVGKLRVLPFKLGIAFAELFQGGAVLFQLGDFGVETLIFLHCLCALFGVGGHSCVAPCQVVSLRGGCVKLPQQVEHGEHAGVLLGGRVIRHELAVFGYSPVGFLCLANKRRRVVGAEIIRLSADSYRDFFFQHIFSLSDPTRSI